MATKRKTTKKPAEPVIEYVDPETNLETPEPIVAIREDTALIRTMVKEAVDQFPDNEFFRCMKRRRDKEK